jgi:hypothetical protein
MYLENTRFAFTWTFNILIQYLDESTNQSTDRPFVGPGGEEPTTQVAETTTQSIEQPATTAEPESDKNCTSGCAPTEEGQALFVCPTNFRRHPQNCNLFYQCSPKDNSNDLNIVVFSCPNGTVYDDEKCQCSPPKTEDENCMQQTRLKRFNMPQSVDKESIVVFLIKLFDLKTKLINFSQIEIKTTNPLCPSEGNHQFQDEQCSRSFVKCSRSTESGHIEGKLYECPEGYVYWARNKACQKQERVAECANSHSNALLRLILPKEITDVYNRRRSLF